MDINEKLISLETVPFIITAKYYIPYILIICAMFTFIILSENFGFFAVFIPLLLLAGYWLIKEGIGYKSDYIALQSIDSSEQPKQGEWTAVCGTTVALDPAIELPFNDVLAYQYQVFDHSMRRSSSGMSQKNRNLRLEGFYLTPMGVKTSRGIVKLSGFPDLFRLDMFKSLPYGLNARAQQLSISLSKGHFLPVFMRRKLLLMNVKDRFEVHIKHKQDDKFNRGSSKYWALKADKEVCIFGIWNDGELLAKSNRPRGLPVYEESIEQLQHRLKGESSGYLVLGKILIGIVVVWLLLVSL